MTAIRFRMFAALVLCVLAACTTTPADNSGGPRLVQEATLQPTDVLPVRVSTNTPIVIAVSTSEADEPDVVTEDAGTPGFVMITPTLPPSKTPTLTPTQSPTSGLTQAATQAPRSTQVQSTVALAPLQATARSASSQPCSAPWFFGSNLISTCPQAAAVEGQGVYLQFQQGFMIWVEQQDLIYVVYDSASAPRWQVFPDEWADGMAERDPNMSGEAPPYTWQPRRGFGLIWVTQPGLRERLGWAVREWEEIFTISVQVAQDGTIFMQDPRGGIIALYSNGRDWDRFVNY